MEGQYDLWVVLLSYAVAVLASYTVLEMAGKVMRPGTRPGIWILAGSLAMGTGIWSMHFIGMEAFSLPIEVIYDAPLTLLSWVAAVAVSALALGALVLLRRRPDSPDPRIVIPAGVIMGLGICIMHYSGMHAMRLSPAIDYQPILVAASVLIAIAASIVTLLIAARLRQVTRAIHIAARFGAAMIMGVAIAGMHYTGMFAARFAPDTICTTTTGLDAGWTTGPITIGTVVILLAALVLSIGDTRAVRRRKQAELERVEVAEEKAFTDPETGLPNRSWLNRQLAESAPGANGSLVLVMFESSDGVDEDRAARMAGWLRGRFPAAQAARVREDSFGLLFYNAERDASLEAVREALREPETPALGDWSTGAASSPGDTDRQIRLVARARAALAAG